MIVTEVASREAQDILLTYHSTNTLNRPLSEIYAQYPLAAFIAHGLAR